MSSIQNGREQPPIFSQDFDVGTLSGDVWIDGKALLPGHEPVRVPVAVGNSSPVWVLLSLVE